MFTKDRSKIEEIQEKIVLLNKVMQSMADNNNNEVSVKNMLLEYCNIYAEIVHHICPKGNRSKCLKILLISEIDLSCDKIFNAHLWASREYVMDLKTRLEKNEIKDIAIERTRIFFDFLPLLKEINKRFPDGLILQSGKRQMEMSAKTAKYTALNIFQGRFGDTSNYPYFTYSYSIFAIRQALELAGNEIIGLDFIRKSKNKRSHKSKLPWEFLKEYKSSKLYELPFDPNDVILVIKWANSFTHTGGDSPCYVVFEALRVLDSVFQYQTKEFTTWDGEKENRREWSIVIYDYAKLKAAFETYLQKKSLTAVWTNNVKLATVQN